MKNKKLKTLVASLALVAALGIGATLAYFTDSDSATNIITMGNVDIDLDEPNFDPGDDDDTIENVIPNQDIVKDPTITLGEDSERAYIRATITYMMDDMIMNPLQASELEALITREGSKLVENTLWVKGEGNYYYYQNIVEPGEKVVFFDHVKIPSNWGNEVADKTIQIIVSAEAIQADNFTPDIENGIITGWNGVNAETYNPSGN